MLHIVSFNVPYPADYGGVIDVFHRIRALHSLGVDIHLHTFQYGRQQQEELKKYCSEVHYYKRNTGLISAFSRKPYIVKSRDNQQLIERLSSDNAPILVEGLHCCSLLEHIDGNRIFVRAHNVEHDYYNNLAVASQGQLRSFYLRTDARRLKRYEPILLKAHSIFAITEADAAHFRSIGCRDVVVVPGFHSFDDVVSLPSTQSPLRAPLELVPYALFHGDLSVPENIEAVMYLVDNIIVRQECHGSAARHVRQECHFIVAGRNPDPALCERLKACPNVRLVANPDDSEMRQLLANAQVQILFTNSPTGLKLKLLNSLFSGRHLLVNSKMVAGTDLAPLCNVADSADQQITMLNNLMQRPFTVDDIALRRSMLFPRYSNQYNAGIIVDKICGESKK